MANKKISELSVAGALTGTESVEVVQGGTNVKTTVQDIADLGGGGTGSGTVNSGTQYRVAYYAATGTAVSEASAITAARALKSDVNGVPTHFDTTTEPSLTELSYVKGVTSAIQTQINNISTYSSTPPEIIYASISGQTMKNKVLTAEYVFRDIDGTAEGTTTFQWIRADDSSGTNVANIAAATSVTYTLVTADVGKYVACKITPVNTTPESGTEYTTAYVGAVDDVYYPADNANTIVSYGIKKMAVAYAGNCIQVQNTNGGATQNIGFDANGDIDWAAVSTFSGGGNTTLKIWYDQSGNGFNMLFTAFADQPAVNPNERRIEWTNGNDGYVTHNATMNISTGDFSFFAEMAQLSFQDAQFTVFEKKTSYSANNLQLYSNIGAGFQIYTGNAGTNAMTSFFATPDYRNVICGYRNSTTKYLRTNDNIKSASETATDLDNTNNIKFNTGDGGDGDWYMWSFTLYKQNYGADYAKYKKFVS